MNLWDSQEEMERATNAQLEAESEFPYEANLIEASHSLKAASEYLHNACFAMMDAIDKAYDVFKARMELNDLYEEIVSMQTAVSDLKDTYGRGRAE